MDELKPEDDLRPDSSDRRPARARKTKTAAVPRVPVSKQHLMIGIGILVLLLLILGIGSALKAPTQHEVSQQTGSKDINLNGSSSLTSGSTAPAANANNDQHDNNGVSTPAAPAAPQPLSGESVSPTPTQAPAVPTPQGQQRVEVPGDINDALNQQPGQLDAAAQGLNGGTAATSTLPTAPATVSGALKPAATAIAPKPIASNKPAAHPSTNRPAATHNVAPHKNAVSTPVKTAAKGHQSASEPVKAAKPVAAKPASSAATPGGNFTLQLSAASKAESLTAYAKEQKLQNYHVQQTQRDGKTWYVLLSGRYATSADAKRAIASLPADVQAKKPWVKPVGK